MLVRLLRDARINHKAGDIVEVSPAQFNFLVSTCSAELYESAASELKSETPEKPKRAAKKKA